ncbi:BppU family phage baseplate upper protein [Staphylococcus sp. LKG3-1]|uniref:BppU family phage baseplate upper protein n=1 Tax=unclassified Staphylococcus TaxID=91994 RepID=UPI003B00D888
MAIFKNKDVQANINNKGVDIGNIGVNFYTEDDNTSSIRIYIKWNGQPVNLNTIDMKPRLDLFLQDKSIFLNEPVDVVLPQSGLIQYIIPTKIIKHIGKVDAKLFLESEERSVHVANFNFNISDSGVEKAVAKEISVNIVDNAVRRIVKENAIEILGDGFEQRLNTDVVKHLDSNPELFKGEKGDTGEQGIQGERGLKGDTGERGPQGLQGPRGFNGQDGLNGARGEKGDTGERGPQGFKGEKGTEGKNSTQVNYRDVKIIADIPLQFEGYQEELAINNTTWYYPQGLALDDEYYFVSYGTPSNNAKTILVIYDRSFNTICKYYLGNQYTESLHVEKKNGLRYLYCQVKSGYISKFDISNIVKTQTTKPIGTPISEYNVGLLYRFTKTNSGWVVEQNNQSKGVYNQQDTLFIYDEEFQNSKGLIRTFPNAAEDLEKVSFKKQSLVFNLGSIKYIVGGLYRKGDGTYPYFSQGVIEIGPDGQIANDYTYSPDELMNKLESLNKTYDRIEHEGSYIYNNELYSSVAYRDSSSVDSKQNGLLIVKYGDSDKDFTMKDNFVNNIPNTLYNPYKTNINSSLINEFTGEEIKDFKTLIKYMAKSYIPKIVFYSSRVSMKDLDDNNLPGSRRIEVENMNNYTFFIRYAGVNVDDFYLISYDKNKDTFSTAKTGREERKPSFDLLSIDYATHFYVYNAINSPEGASSNGFVKVKTDNNVRRMIYEPENSWDSYVNIYYSGSWKGWKKVTTVI